MEEAKGIGEGESVEAGIACVDYAETVATAEDAEERPGLSVDNKDIAEVLGLPLGVDGGVVAGGVEEEGAIGVETAVEKDEMAVEFGAIGEAKWGLESGRAEGVSAEEAGYKIDAGETEGVVVVPEIAGVLEIGVGEGRRGECGANGGEVGGEPCMGVTVTGRRVDAAVKVDDGWDARGC